MSEITRNEHAEPDPERLLELFKMIRELPLEDRAETIERLTGDDRPLRDELSSLLDHETTRGSGLTPEIFGDLREDFLRDFGVEGPGGMPEFIGGYRIEELLGEGGMGRVYAARQPKTGQRVALKLIRPGHITPRAMRRFGQEVEFLGRLQHAGIARVLEAGETDLHGVRQPFIAMEFVEGVDFRRWSQGRARSEVIDVMIRIARAVHHAHLQGVIHRDLKPANVLVDEQGAPKILDFGVARAAGEDTGAGVRQTMTGQLVGTLEYMSPEQLEGRPEELGFSSDVYALGGMTFEAMSGRLPHELDELPLRRAIEVVCNEKIPSLQRLTPNTPLPLQQAVEKALAREVGERYASAAAFADDLGRWRADRAVLAQPPSTWQNLRLFARRNRVLATVVPLIVVLLAGGVIFSSLFANRAARAQTRAERAARNSDRAAYRLALGSAEIALQRNDTGSARSFLEAASPELRGWEWHHLTARLEQSLGRLETGLPRPCVVRTPLRVESEGQRAVFVAYQGFQEKGVVRVAEIDLEEDRIVLNRPVKDLGGIEIGERERPSFGLTDDGRLVALDRARGIVWEEPRDGSGPRREYPIDSLPRRVKGPDLEIREQNGILIGFRTGGEEWNLLHDAGQNFTMNRVSSDGHLLATVGMECDTDFIEIYDLRTGVRTHVLEDFAEDPHDIAFSPDGERLVACLPDGTLVVDHLDAPEARRILRGHLDRVSAVAFCPVGELIASGSQDATIRIWDPTRDTPLRTLAGHDDEIMGLAFPTKDSLTSIDRASVARRWGLSKAGDAERGGHGSYVYPLALSPDGKLLAAGDWSGVCIIRDALSGKELARHQIVESTSRYDIVTELEFTPDGAHLVVTYGHAFYSTQSMRVIEPLSGATVRDFGKVGALVTLAATTNPPRIVLAAKGEGRVYDPATWNETHRFPARRRGLAVDPGGRRFAHRIESYQRYQIRDAATGTVVHDLDLSAEGGVRTPSDADAVAFSPDGRILAMAAGRDILIVEIEKGVLLRRLKGHTGDVFSLAFSPDGRRLASGADDRTVRMWDTVYYEELVALSGHRDHVQTVLWSHDGTRLYSSSGDYTVRIWDQLTRRERRTLHDR